MVRRPFPPAVWLLGWVSLLTDAASEAIYPLLPFLTSVLGGGPVALGIIEGIAEGTNSVLRIVSGRVADRTGARRRLVVAGYALSSAARPLIAVATAWWQVLVIRFGDRVGKGVRSAPRDAMLACWADPADLGRVYGFHRAMDHAGAVVGPLVASVFLLAAPGQYRTLFLLTAVPARSRSRSCGACAMWMRTSRKRGTRFPRGRPPHSKPIATLVRAYRARSSRMRPSS